jgi:hypothetical protein
LLFHKEEKHAWKEAIERNLLIPFGAEFEKLNIVYSNDKNNVFKSRATPSTRLDVYFHCQREFVIPLRYYNDYNTK